MDAETQKRRRGWRVVLGVTTVLVVGVAAVSASPGAQGDAVPAGGGTGWTALECGTYSGTGCSPSEKRVDLTKPVFSHPATFTNPLYPVSSLQSTVMLGQAEGRPFRSESTLLPRRQVVVWDGKRIDTLVVQYAAFRDGRIEEVAIDRYAQADDGSVWYLGEDIVDYADGRASMTAGTWLAGLDGPPAMIMPANPKLGNVYRSENLPGIVFEEMLVTEVGKTVQGVRGPVAGAIVSDELSLTGGHATKVLAPGYGEFSTSSGAADHEDLATAVPIDAPTTPEPAELTAMWSAAGGLFRALQSEDWVAAQAIARRVRATYQAIPQQDQPAAVVAELRRAVTAAGQAVKARDASKAGQAAIDAARSVLDLQLRYRPQVAIDRSRFELWCDQLMFDAAANDAAGASGDVATLEWIRDRFVGALDAGETAELDARLRSLRIAVDAGQLAAAADHAARLGERVRSLGV